VKSDTVTPLLVISCHFCTYAQFHFQIYPIRHNPPPFFPKKKKKKRKKKKKEKPHSFLKFFRKKNENKNFKKKFK